MKIKSIYIDGLHNAINKTYQFGDIVYIFGHNGAGKSTILQAIQFALLGYIPGTAKNSREALLRHSPKNEIEVTLILSDIEQDISICRSITSKGSKFSTIPENYDISPIISELELPIFNFNDFIGQTANKLKEFFIKNILPTANGTLDWRQILSDSTLDCNFTDKDAIIDYGMSLLQNIEGDALDQVIAANTIFKQEQSFNKSEMQRLQNTIDSLIFYDDYLGPTDLAEINTELLSLGAIRDQLIKYESAAAATQATKDEFDQLEKDINALGGKEGYDSLNSEIAELKDKLSKYNSIIAQKRDEISAMCAIENVTMSILNSNGICPYTKQSCESIINKIEDIHKDADNQRESKSKLEQELAELLIKQTDLQTQIRQKESTVSDFLTIWNRLVTIQKTMTSLPQKPITDKSITDLDIEIEQLTDSKMKLQANIKYNETIDNITKLKFEAELQSKALSSWVKKTDTNGLQTTLMAAPFDELANTMTNYIQQMYGNNKLKAHFNISTKANSFSFGLIRDNVYIPYDLLSSGEKCLYALSLMICITNNNKSPLKLMLCDDMFDHLDSIVIENAFTALKNINNIQFIFAGVKECNAASDIMITIS